MLKKNDRLLSVRLCFSCFLLLAIAAFACFNLCGAVRPENDAPGVSLCEAILLAEQYLTENHIAMPRNLLQTVELIDAGNIKKWKILWKFNKWAIVWENDRTAVPPIEGVYVKMDRTVDPIKRQVIYKEEPQQSVTSRPAEEATLQGILTILPEGLPFPGMFIMLQSSSALWQTVTNETGAFLISGLAPGDYLFKCFLSGFATKYRILHLHGGEIRQLDFQQDVLPIIGEDVFDKKPLRGNVYINKRIPFPGVKVTATAKDFSQTVTSMNNGEFRFFGLEEDGAYILRFSHEGFQDIITTCMVGPGTRPKTEIHFIIPWLCE